MTRKTFVFLIAVVFLLSTLATKGQAQIEVKSEFLPGPDANHVTAHCETDASQLSANILSKYNAFNAVCTVKPGNGAAISSTDLPPGISGDKCVYALPAKGAKAGSTAIGNPIGDCQFIIPKQPGVKYTITSTH